MNNLRLYRIDIDYIKYLYSFDNRIQYNPDREDEYTAKRPYLGVVLKIDKFDYFVPLEHPRQAHQKMKNNIFIFKIHNGKYGILGFNNMIPVKQAQLIDFDINKENAAYKQVLISQYHFCNKHSKEIEEKAKETYTRSLSNSFMKKICCNFKLLEHKCLEYKKHRINLPPTINNIIDEFVNGVNKILGNRAKKIILYGSYARGDYNKSSDIDIMILTDLSDDEIHDFFIKISDMAYDIELENDVIFSPLIRNIDKFNYWLEAKPFYMNVVREGIILSES